jgi:hypothetical protein
MAINNPPMTSVTSDEIERKFAFACIAETVVAIASSCACK